MAQPAPPPVPPPQPASPPYPQPYPPPYGPPGPPYYPPPPKTTNVALIVLVVVIVVVLITVGLAAILYLMVGGLITDGPPGRPFISFGPPSVSGTDVTFEVAGASRSVLIGSYSVNLLVNTTAGTPRPLATSFTIAVGQDSFFGNFTDSDGNGLLTARDTFRITASTGWLPGITYQFEVLWTDASPVGFRTWTV